MIDDYAQKDRDAVNPKNRDNPLCEIAPERTGSAADRESLPVRRSSNRSRERQRQIVYEQLSYQIYLEVRTRKQRSLSQRAQQEIEITRLTSLKNHLLRKIDTYDLHKIYLELKGL